MKQELSRKITGLLRLLRETPVIKLEAEGMHLFAKLEGHSPVGSLKDRPALWILRNAAERGELNERTTLIESSSGNFASAIAFFAHVLNLKFIPVVDPNILSSYETFLRDLCGTVVKVTERDEGGSFLGTRLRKVKELCDTTENSFWTNQYGNVDAIEAHYRLTGADICAQLDKLDYVFIGVSTGATIAGVSRRLKERFPHVRVVAVDAEGSVIFGGPSKKRYIPGIGASIRPKLLDQALIDDVVIVPEIETINACRKLLMRHGVLVGGSSGSCYAAVKRMAPSMRSSKPPNVLFLCADRGTAYANTIYDDAWVAKLASSQPQPSNYEHGIFNRRGEGGPLNHPRRHPRVLRARQGGLPRA
jgi:N-(2-amino-2-carboxyethyl)-L-glutamate synthase